MLKGKLLGLKVTSEVPQGSVLRLILFNTFLRYMTEKKWSMLMKFIDDTNMGGIINIEKNWNMIQEEWNYLEDVYERNGMKYNSIK